MRSQLRNAKMFSNQGFFLTIFRVTLTYRQNVSSKNWISGMDNKGLAINKSCFAVQICEAYY